MPTCARRSARRAPDRRTRSRPAAAQRPGRPRPPGTMRMLARPRARWTAGRARTRLYSPPSRKKFDVLAGLEMHRLVGLDEDRLDRRRQRLDPRVTVPGKSRTGMDSAIGILLDLGLDGHVGSADGRNRPGSCPRRARSPSARSSRPRRDRSRRRAPGPCRWRTGRGSRRGQPDPRRRAASRMVWPVFHLDRLADRFNGQFVAHGALPFCCAFSGGVRGARIAPRCGRSAAGTLDAGEAGRAEADHVLVLEAVLGQRLVEVGVTGLPDLNLGLRPVDLREIGVVAEGGCIGPATTSPKRMVGGNGKAKARRTAGGLPSRCELVGRRGTCPGCRRGRIHISKLRQQPCLVSLFSDRCGFGRPQLRASDVLRPWPRHSSKFFLSSEPSKSRLSRPCSRLRMTHALGCHRAEGFHR